MADIVKYNTRVQQKADTAANWALVPDFIPLEGEIIVYSDLRLMKVGNGETTIGELPFSGEILLTDVAFIDMDSNEDVENPDIIMTEVVVDSEFSTSSVNPVQNKVITEKINGLVPTNRKINEKELNEDIVLTAADVEAAPASHTQVASTVTAGTFAGQVVANSSGQTPATSLLRNSKLVTTDTNPTVNGEICWTYK